MGKGVLWLEWTGTNERKSWKDARGRWKRRTAWEVVWDMSCVMCDVWCVICDVWCVICDMWCVMCDVWWVMCDMRCEMWDVWYVMCDVWCVICDVWYAMCDVWYGICDSLYDVWYVMCDVWGLISLFQMRHFCTRNTWQINAGLLPSTFSVYVLYACCDVPAWIETTDHGMSSILLFRFVSLH